MNQPKHAKWAGVFVLLLSLSFTVYAQENRPLRNILSDIMSESESYEEYKVIKTSKLLNFRTAMIDSISAYQLQIKNLEMSSIETKAELKTIQTEFDLIKEKLQISEDQNAKIGFLGLSVKKGFYNALVWSLIALLATIVVVVYTRIKHVCSVVKRVKSAYSKIVEEYRHQRFQATEKQITLRRELQTALNRLESLESGVEQ
ncbi:hypothetical protein BFP97_06895 [Roseivirga sp. 4D4]|uniref:hypothetical protein n=1 Tax=Roseivirga sp. 4D4 TaxID=1889784 RepID=UPI000852C806|nr:hypothetical protein [Roseivirga sp. 4D4]OEK01254.1 hypothetical protein BFP97_06895 [Roseivirga sp. 4D4]